jgi:hypothetical protein
MELCRNGSWLALKVLSILCPSLQKFIDILRVNCEFIDEGYRAANISIYLLRYQLFSYASKETLDNLVKEWANEPKMQSAFLGGNLI